MTAVRAFQIIASIAALVAVAFGMATFTHSNFTSIHMLFGLLLAISLLVVSIIAVLTRGLRRLGITGLV